MAKYIIKQYETAINIYEAEGKSMLEALLEFRNGNVGDFVGHEDFSPEANNDLGESFECLPEEISDEDIEIIRSKFNSNRNNDFLESIYEIKEAK